MPPSRRSSSASLLQQRGKGGTGKHGGTHILATLFALLVTAPLVFLAVRFSSFGSALNAKDFFDQSHGAESARKLTGQDHQMESFFPEEVLSVILANSDDPDRILRLKAVKDTPSSLVQEHDEQQLKFENDGLQEGQEGEITNGTPSVTSDSFNSSETGQGKSGLLLQDVHYREQPPEHIKLRREKERLLQLTKHDEKENAQLEAEAIERTKVVSRNIMGKYSIWRREDNENSDNLVRLMREQLIMARVYASIAQSRNNLRLLRDLKLRIRETTRALGDANLDSDLSRSAHERIRTMGQTLTQARSELYDCGLIVRKLRATLQSSQEYAQTLKKQSTFLSQLAAKTIPKALHCLSLRLNVEYYTLPPEKREFPSQEKLDDPTLFHYALFSDNILAASVVVSSTVRHAQEPHKHVIHVVTDRLNYGAMRMWFLANPPGKATIEVQNIDDFKWLNSSYCPVLRQLESAAMKDYYFKPDHPTSVSSGSSNLKYRNPKYLSMLNHLRFYLPQIYPKLDKILFLDDDIVVQKDLTGLWSIDLQGKVNGAVETCGASFHRFDKYLNFSNPHIARNFNPDACGWAYGMNVFDLKEWKRRDITGIYHKWQNMNEDRLLWKLGTLPPGLITFYNLTHPLDKSWHVLGLGYNPSIDKADMDAAAVVHYNGNLKPWLDIGLSRYKSYWTRYVSYDHPYLQQCNINH
ncbi:polygalacturonate 4-alpha-galacturonosyltransferase [Selaginella moellendorffii]|uniref:polygalacturonate 4-alpha-galacturonosyltransferase n=1 Tax=Selaginella moellendorffii TaxID=88036 RepID=UPI000D1C7714|nr:polygalacturonate 4-alpha-galacturonosyltransferase [Selaginella moellendorffii]|eukprot:XP_002980359.2 polygalacturonate 4-alpha-galacturonosyltransferase [Selaginella moellendorffii]